METNTIVAAQVAVSRTSFFTPASSASSPDEFENQMSCATASKRSIVFPRIECMLGSQKSPKDPYSLSGGSLLDKHGHGAVCTSREPEADLRTKLPDPIAIHYTGTLSWATLSENVSTAKSAGRLVVECAPPQWMASFPANTLAVTPETASPCAPSTKEASSISFSAVSARRDNKPENFTEDTRCGDSSIVDASLKIHSRTHRAQKYGSLEDLAATTGPVNPHTISHSTQKIEGSSSTSLYFTRSAGALESWMPRQTHISIQGGGLCSRPSLAALSCASWPAQKSAASLLAPARLPPCRLVKCASDASTACTVNIEPLQKEILQDAQHPVSDQEPATRVLGENMELSAGRAGSSAADYASDLSVHQLASCRGQADVLSNRGKEPAHSARVRLTVQQRCNRQFLCKELRPTCVNAADAAQAMLRPVGPCCSKMAPIQFEPRSDREVKTKHCPPTKIEASKQEFNETARLGKNQQDENETQQNCRISSTVCRHTASPWFNSTDAQSNMFRSDFCASGPKSSLPWETPAERHHLNKFACYTGDAEVTRSTLPRITPAVKKTQCVLRPSFPLFSPNTDSKKDAPLHTRYTHEEVSCKTSEPSHCQDSHTRKARRCADFAECVSSATTRVACKLSSVVVRGHSDSRIMQRESDYLPKQPPAANTEVSVPAVRSSQSTELQEVEATVAQELQRRKTDVGSYLRNSSPLPQNHRDISMWLPLRGKEVVKRYSHQLSTFEREEILEYDEVWYWGARRATPPDGMRKTGACNSGFDNEKGDYLVIFGDHIDYRFEVIKPLGRGSFGQVFAVYDHKKQEKVALKIVRNKKHFHSQGRVEIHMLQTLLQHDKDNKANVIHMKDHLLFRNHLMITFELLTLNVYEFLKQNLFKGLSSLAVRSIAIQLLQALRLLRKQQIVHCDLKPENIVLKNIHKSGIKVIDFGSSCREGQMPYSYIQSRFYRSPEVILGLTYNCAIDMWSLGCILAELQTGQPLFPGENELDQVNCIVEVLGPPPAYLVSQSPRKKLFFKATGEPKISANTQGKKRKVLPRGLPSVLRADDTHFIDFIRECLQWDPARRLTPEQAMQHQWIKDFKVLRQRKQLSSN